MLLVATNVDQTIIVDFLFFLYQDKNKKFASYKATDFVKFSKYTANILKSRSTFVKSYSTFLPDHHFSATNL